MSKILPYCKVLLALALLLSPSLLIGQTTHLEGHFIIGSSDAAHYPNFEAAITDLRNIEISGDVTYTVEEGVYNESIDLRNLPNGEFRISFEGVSAESTIIHPLDSIAADRSGISMSGSSHITLQNMTLEMGDISATEVYVSYDDTKGVSIFQGSDIAFRDMMFTNANSSFDPTASKMNIASTISLNEVSDITIDGCAFSGAGKHVYVHNYENITISHSTFSDLHWGIYSDQHYRPSWLVGPLIIENNTFTGPWSTVRRAIYLVGDDDSFPESTNYLAGLEIRNNTIDGITPYNLQSSIYIEYTVGAVIEHNYMANTYYGLWANSSPGLKVLNNEVRDIEYRGVVCANSDNAVFRNNIVVGGSSAGLYLDGVENLEFVHNTIAGPTGPYGAVIYRVTGDGTIVNNIFDGGTINAFCLYTSDAATLTMDHNLYGSESTGQVKLSNVTLAGVTYDHQNYTLAEWQNLQNLYDQNSESFEPVLDDNYRITSMEDYRFGTYLANITKDIDNQPRLPETGIDVGADQYCHTYDITIDTTVCASYVFDGLELFESGTYQNSYLTAVGCDSLVTLNLVVDPTLATCEVTGLDMPEPSALSAYPNPNSHGLLHVEGHEPKAPYTLLDAQGRQIASGILSTGSIKLPESKGFYILQVYSGKHLHHFKIIKE